MDGRTNGHYAINNIDEVNPRPVGGHFGPPVVFPEYQENGGAKRRQIFSTFPGSKLTPIHQISSLRSPQVRSY